MPPLVVLPKLLTEASQDPSNPFLRQAVKGAENEFMAPPPIPTTPQTPLSSGQSVTPFDPKLTLPGSTPQIAAGPMNTGSQQSGGIDEEGTKPSFWKSDEFKDIGRLGLSSLLGAGAGALAGDWKSGAAAGGLGTLRDMQEQQAGQLKRRQAAWESAYNEALSLPADIHQTPGMEEVARAQQNLIKDLQDGKIDNEKNLTDFYKAKAMYGKDIEQLQLNKKLQQDKEAKDAMYTADMERQKQEAISLQRIVQDPSIPDNAPEKLQANARLAEINKTLVDQKAREQEQQRLGQHQQFMQGQERAQTGIQQQGLNLQKDRMAQQDKLAQQTIQSREDVAKMARLNSSVNAAVAQTMRANPDANESAVRAQAIKDIAGLVMISPGNIMVLGKPVRLDTILGQRPELWDPNGTPSAAGWDVITSAIMDQGKIASAQAANQQPLSLTGAYGQ